MKNRFRAHRISRAEKGDDRQTQCVGKVHAAGVVGNEQSRAAKLIGEGQQIGFARQIRNVSSRQAGANLVRDHSVILRAEQDEARVRESLCEPFD